LINVIDNNLTILYFYKNRSSLHFAFILYTYYNN